MTLTRTLLRTAVPVAAVATVLAGAGTASASSVAFTAYDTDGNGYADAHGFDDDGDGYEDTWAIDWDEDGVAEQITVDTDLDGWADTFAFDSDEDGYVEEVGVDTTYNGLPDVWGADADLDGYVDAYAHDVDDDGCADWSEPAASAGYAYATVTVVLAQAGGWTYWEIGYEYGYSTLTSADRTDAGVAPLTGSEKLGAATSTDADLPGDAVADVLHGLAGLF